MTAPNVLVPIAVLPPGTNQYNLVGLSPDTPYTIVLAHQEPPPSTGFTPPAEVSFTSSASVGTLAAPDDPLAFVIPQPPSHGGMPICGFACYNTEPVPGTSILVQIATETSIGSGTYGSWQTIDSIPTNPLSWAVKTLTIQQDGLRRQFQGQATRAGCNPSSFTPVVTLNPSVALTPTDYPVTVPLVAYTPQDIQQPDRMAVTIVATYTPPAVSEFDHMEYLVAQRQANGTYSSPQTVVGGKTGTDAIVTMPASLNGTGAYYQIQAVTVTNGEAGNAPIPGATTSTSLPVRTYGPTLGVFAPPLSNAPTVIIVPSPGTSPILVEFDAGTAYIMAYQEDFGTSNPGTVLSVESSAQYVGPNLVPGPNGNTTIWFAATTASHYYAITCVPYNSSGIRGTPITQVFLAPASGTAPSAPTIAVETWPGSGGGNWAFPHWVVLKITLGTPVAAGDFIWLISLNPEVLITAYVITSADVTNGYATIIDTSPSAVGTAYTYGGLQWSVSGAAGSGITPLNYSVTLRAGFTLTTPTLVWSAAGVGQVGKLVAVSTPSNTYPPAALADIQYRVGAAGPPWVDLGPLPAGDNSFAAVPVGFSGSIYGTATVSAPGYTTSAAGTGSTTYP